MKINQPAFVISKVLMKNPINFQNICENISKYSNIFVLF